MPDPLEICKPIKEPKWIYTYANPDDPKEEEKIGFTDEDGHYHKKIICTKCGTEYWSSDLSGKCNNFDCGYKPYKIDLNSPELIGKFTEDWVGRKIIKQVKDHLAKYPTFSHWEEYIDDVLDMTPNQQKRQTFCKIQTWNKWRKVSRSVSRQARNSND